MAITRVRETYSIMPIANMASVASRGILSHYGVLGSGIAHEDISMSGVQGLRERKVLPSGLRLHSYVNLYFDARNPMMYKRRYQAENLCILIIDIEVANESGCYASDRNASCMDVKFFEAKDADANLKWDYIYARDWRHLGNPEAFYAHKSVKCSELLVPNTVSYDYIVGANVIAEAVKSKLENTGFNKPIYINSDMFFRKGVELLDKYKK